MAYGGNGGGRVVLRKLSSKTKSERENGFA